MAIYNLIKGNVKANGLLNRELVKYLAPQNPNTQEKVDGKWVTFTPNKRYYAESKEVVDAAILIKKGRWKEANLRYGIPVIQEAMGVVMQGGPKVHEPDVKWAPKDTNYRAPVTPSSSAIGWMRYSITKERVDFKFRTKKGLGQMYSGIMNGKQLSRWLGSASIGRYFNRRLKGKMVSA